MDTAAIDHAISDAVAGRRLLDHPFYRRWEAGALLPGELAGYAAQYRHFEATLPDFLAAVAESLPPGRARRAVEANLRDELGDPVSHLELFDRFAGALGADRAEASPATAALVRAYEELAAAGAVAGLAGLAAYEHQAPAIAESKAAGLRTRYRLDGRAVTFWDHHAVADVAHARWTTEALSHLDADPVEVRACARVVADAWWRFLDEREAVRPAA